jgi:glycerol-3-phosphate acyltransferase PlsY
VIALAVCAAYLLGGLPFSYWVVRWLQGADLRELGSGNPGATNVLRVAGPLSGLLALGLDILKGWIAVELARRLGVAVTDLGPVALAVVVGHAFPPWLRFHGGKGVAAAAGVLLALAPAALAVAAAVFVVVVATSRIVSLGSMAAAVAVPVAHWGLRHWRPDAAGTEVPQDESMIGWLVLISVFVVVRHRGNLRRLWTGREARLGDKGEDAAR